ncbi:MAG: glycoside hydrolase, partial [Fibrobacter sp.]|nr:glycoside hydrolase [Fibrobacter sp.]
GYRLYADTASEYLGDVLNISTEAGMPLVVWKQTGTQNQSFKFEYMGDESAYSSSSVEVAPESSSSEAVSSSSAETTSLVAAPGNLGVRIVGVSRVDGLRFSQAADYALMNLHGMVVARGHAAQVAVRNLAPGAYVVRLGGRVQKIELR